MNIVVADDIEERMNQSGLQEFAELELSTGFGVQDAKVEQEVECEKYTVEGEEACSYIISSEQYTQGKDMLIMQIITRLGGTGYYFSYGNLRDDFDSQLPAFEQLVESFRTTNDTEPVE